MSESKTNLTTLYTQLCDSYHKVDDFRAKLLGFLPLASGVAILGLLDLDDKGQISEHLVEIGLFGMLITFGLLLYELKGIQKCTGFIYYGQIMEEELLGAPPSKFTGQFMGLNRPERGRYFATEPVASAVVYATVLAAWTYVATVKTDHSGIFWPLAAFIIVLVGVIVFWRRCAEPKAKA